MASSLKEINNIIVQKSGGCDPTDPISKINEQIFLGQGRTTCYPELLTQLGITHIVSIGKPPHKAVQMSSFEKLEIAGVEDLESQVIINYFPIIFEFMRKAISNGGKIYVHCEMGISRSATAVVAFLRADGYFGSLQESYNHVKLNRSLICPNAGFIRQLSEFFSEKLII